MKIVTIVGARPQFIKAAVISRCIRTDFKEKIQEVLVHTGQHYDENMSNVFFEELDIPTPNYQLNISGGKHGAMTGRMLEAIERVLLQERPDCVLLYGDTNSTLAGALAAVKLRFPIAHVEAGLRSFNMQMPEEVNRILTDRVSTLLFCPTETAAKNLKTEGISNGVYNVGDVMFDASLFYRNRAKQQSSIIDKLNLIGSEFVLATCHRAENTDNPERLKNILSALSDISTELPVVMPLHPRTRILISEYGLSKHLLLLITTDPLPFLDMVALEQAAKVILTDSGGVQKEAFFYGVPCVTIRDETEWIETLEHGWNRLAGTSTDGILKTTITALKSKMPTPNVIPYGDGNSANKILSLLLKNIAANQSREKS